MADKDQSFSDFLNDDDDDEFDIEKLAREFDECDFDQAQSDEDGANELFDGKESSDSSGGLSDGEISPPLVREVEDESFEVSPTSILEGMLFVGNPENRPATPEEMSALMRGVSVDDIDDLVAELNESYRATNSPFEIIFEKDGYRLVLAKGYEFCRNRFYREEKAASLSQSVIDVLALVAYLQPVSKTRVEEKRMKPCGSILNQLVRRKLIEVERVKERNKTVVLYRTTERFLELFGIDSIEELPKSQTFESPG